MITRFCLHFPANQIFQTDKNDEKFGKWLNIDPKSVKMGEESGVSIYFLLAKGKSSETCSEDLSDAFDQSKENGLEPTWMDTDKALKHTPLKTVRFS